MNRLRLAPIVLLAFVAGCSTPTSGSPDTDPLYGADLSAVSTEQSAEIDDRIATADEYQAAFQRYRECLSAAGFEMTEVDLTTPLFGFSVPDAAVVDGADDECYQAEFYYVDVLWQITDDIQNNSETAQLYRECLQARNIEPGATLDEMSEQLRAAGVQISECL